VDENPLREWLVDRFMYRAHAGWVTSGSSEMFHPDFMHEVTVGMARERAVPKEFGKVHDANRHLKKLRSDAKDNKFDRDSID
jgi:hypothetical protein